MKILQIIYSLSTGGAERFVVDLSNELSKQGHDVTLCMLRDDKFKNFGFYKNDLAGSVKFISLGIPVGFSLNTIPALYKLIKNVNPQVVHCHLNLVNYVFPIMLIFRKIKFFHTIHSDASKEVKSRIEFFIRRFFYSNRIARPITISKESSRSFIDFYKGDFYYEIYNGCLKPEPSAEFLKVKEGIDILKKQGNSVFIHIGRFNLLKNQEMLIKTFNKLVEDKEKVVLLIIGSGFTSEKGEYLKKIACEKIFFLGEKHNISDYLLNADAFCLSSLYEGMPISLIEAFACGCTPICTPVGGIINSIDNRKTGYIAKSTSDSDYFDTMLDYLNNKDEIKREDLISYYYSRFSIEECAKNHLSIY